jgi:hypothetical protein
VFFFIHTSKPLKILHGIPLEKASKPGVLKLPEVGFQSWLKFEIERLIRIELTQVAWKATALPLSYRRNWQNHNAVLSFMEAQSIARPFLLCLWAKKTN